MRLDASLPSEDGCEPSGPHLSPHVRAAALLRVPWPALELAAFSEGSTSRRLDQGFPQAEECSKAWDQWPAASAPAMAETVFSIPSAFEQVGFAAFSIRARAGPVRPDVDLDGSTPTAGVGPLGSAYEALAQGSSCDR